MQKRMLIDTTHAEETRVVVMDGDRLEDYDVETTARKQIKGNIYLAKVIRIEPSLQAAFVDYGGNRHGFLAFSEIHPDYFQIPVADREELLALQNADIDDVSDDVAASSTLDMQADDAMSDPADDDIDDADAQPAPEVVGGENDTGEESNSARRMARFLRNYRIQEVIRRRQILLVQIVKEERGNKGAALTTYISLPGRYCVLMPNALRGGGVSRKITSENDRRRLRDIIAELQLPRNMAMIVRTAGAQRPGPEITRDCEYLLQLWDQIRDRTLSSIAPELVYEEANLIKRAIRDLFSKDISEISVDGEEGWKSARDFMRNLMPHNANLVKLWRNQGQSLFARHRVEGHLDAIFSPTATLKSGGYIVINQTEALVSIDVNSGRSTGQRNIEDTAVRTNLEAADEVARQLRLRDLAGLVVIDFIDMESRRHNTMVEKRLKEALKADRARIQIGQISHFGLLEMSRQRLRASIAEATLTTCPHCKGTGFIRGTESAALQVLRAIDEEGLRQRAAEISVHVSTEVALYILNQKRQWLAEIEQRHGMQVQFIADDGLVDTNMRIERVRPHDAPPRERQMQERPVRSRAPQEDAPDKTEHNHPRDVAQDVAMDGASGQANAESDEEGNESGRRRRRRRRSRGGRRSDHQGENFDIAATHDADEFDGAIEADAHPGVRATPAGEPRSVRQIEISGPEAVAARQKRQPTQGRTVQRESAEEQLWRGRPTPADPFAGASFDIFDMIEESPVMFEVNSGESRQASAQDDDARQPENPTIRRGPRRGLRRGRGRRDEMPHRGASTTPDEISEPPAEATEAHVAVTSQQTHTPVEQSTSPAPDSEKVAEVAPKPARPARRRKTRVEDAGEVATEARQTPPSEPAALSEEVSSPKPKPRRRATRVKPSADADIMVKEKDPAVQPVNVDEIKAPPQRTGWWKR